MAKKVNFQPKPQAANPDEWVSAGAVNKPVVEPSAVASKPLATSKAETVEATVPMKRLTIDIPNDLHVRIKMQCAARSRKMADEIREILEERFGASSTIS